jgi:hypothetical protein
LHLSRALVYHEWRHESSQGKTCFVMTGKISFPDRRKTNIR